MAVKIYKGSDIPVATVHSHVVNNILEGASPPFSGYVST
jgi:hypothetical protein